MSDIRPGPVTRRLECYRLAAIFLAPSYAVTNVLERDFTDWAGRFHNAIYGGPLPPAEVEQEVKE